MDGLNKVILIGNLARDPELRATSTGKSVCEFTLAVNDGKEEKAYFAAVVTFGATADACSRYLAKGSQAMVEGKLTNDEWEDKQTGQKRSRTRVYASRVLFIGGSPKTSQKPVSGSDYGYTAPTLTEQPRYTVADAPPDAWDSPEIPF